ncbi:hypothetical protein FACS1894208_09480 [Clostridia bacterium]|nr:hypothetical protein FACS1894208_09480 [Clostridia bacterium]
MILFYATAATATIPRCVAAVLIAAGGVLLGLWQINEKLIKPLENAKTLNAAYYEVYGDVNMTVTGYIVTKDANYGSEIKESDIEPVTLPPNIADYGVATDYSELAGKYYRIDISANTLITRDMLMEIPINHDDRAFDVITSYNPIGLQPGDLVDIRMTLPTGEDYVALPRKRVEGIYGGVLRLIMSEIDIVVYNSLIADTALYSGASVYSTLYLDGSQNAAEEFYPVSTNVLKTALQDPNIASTLKYSDILAKRAALENDMALLDDPENERVSALLRQSRLLIPDRIAAGQSAWQTEQDVAEQKRLEGQLYGGG